MHLLVPILEYLKLLPFPNSNHSCFPFQKSNYSLQFKMNINGVEPVSPLSNVNKPLNFTSTHPTINPNGNSRLMSLPYEMRENIFKFCVTDAISRSKDSREKTNEIRSGVTNLALTLWPEPLGETKLITKGIGSIPLLFTNKQIFAEVSKVVYSNLSEILISPQYFLYINEHPDTCGDERIHSQLQQKVTRIADWKNGIIKIQMPSIVEDLHSLGKHWGERSPKLSHTTHDSWAIAPGLERFLKTFSNLPSVEVVDLSTLAPDFRKLLPIYDMIEEKMVFPKLFEFDPRFVEEVARE